MKMSELKNMAPEDLKVKLGSCKEELGKLEFQKATGRVDKPHRFKELRRTIARIHTLLRVPESKE
jgi:large subunit ribosomal protein L29